MRKDLAKVLAELLHLPWVERNGRGIWIELLTKSPVDWLSILGKWGVDPEGDNNPNTDDDPVPKSIHRMLFAMNTDAVYEALQAIPKRKNASYPQRLQKVRKAITVELRDLWRECVRGLRLRLPLLILDEAHHLKNPNTQLASLFRSPAANEDMEQMTRGSLAGAFERMLFLTATPFQLGHGELCSVLDRFDGIAWKSPIAPKSGQTGFREDILKLRRSLDAAQTAALSLDAAWGRLRADDLQVSGQGCASETEWWTLLRAGGGSTPTSEQVLQAYESTGRRMRDAEKALRPWVIRHLKARSLPSPHEGIARRRALAGAGILLESAQESEGGLLLHGEALLPFLLAARATTQAPDSRPVFAEGLASSYEAFLQTRLHRRLAEHAFLDGDDDKPSILEPTDAARWYLDQLERLIPQGNASVSNSHPKIAATVNRAIDLWRAGEKVVVFCHYIATGKVLRQRISEAVEHEIRKVGATKLGCLPAEVQEQLERIGKRFFDDDSPIRRACDASAMDLLEEFPALSEYREELVEIFRRNVRTPSFLVRFLPLHKQLDEKAMTEALRTQDSSGMCLYDILREFFRFLVGHCGDEDRRRYIEAVKGIQTGTHFGQDTGRAFSDDELQGERPERLVPNVRLVNGSTKSETRQRLMLTFNTPFYPEILVTSNVLAEGVDLHLNCRYLIHHDLCWNPSTLEQRTGRIDRIGAKAERCGQSIFLYLPYIAETQDEKMFRVVMDRERWFSVVMGENYKVDARSLEKLAARIPLPESAARELAFRLEVAKSK
jgi:hypothetical protein